MRILYKIILTIGLCHGFHSIFSQVEIWGVTADGGKFDQGCMYRTDENGDNQEILYSFTGPTGIYPKAGSPTALSNGKIYGLLTGSEEYNIVIFEFDPADGSYAIAYQHNDPLLGHKINAGMVEGRNGALFGTTIEGGNFNQGVLFEYDIQGKRYYVRHHFEESGGSEVYGKLCAGNDGLLYGLTHRGGVHNAGVIFRFDPEEHAYSKLFEFNSVETGSHPQGHLISASDGLLYGMTRLGGDYDRGTIFRIDPESGFFETLFHFDGENQGGNPLGGLIEVEPYVLYGLTSKGGSSNDGTLFVFNVLFKTYNTLHDFSGMDGAHPNGSLIYDGQSILRGTTFKGGQFDYGILFEFDLENSQFSKTVDFLGREKGMYPLGDLLMLGDGRMFSYCSRGGKYDKGVLFEYDLDNGIFVHIDFNEDKNGIHPLKIITGMNGLVYGINKGGGEYDQGTLFKYDPILNSYTKTYDFKTNNQYLYPVDMICGTDGNLYGILSSEDNPEESVLFQYNLLNNSFMVIEDDFGMRNFTGMEDLPNITKLQSLTESPDHKIIINQPGYASGGAYTISKGVTQGGDVWFTSRFYCIDLNTLKEIECLHYPSGNQYGNPLFTSNGKIYTLNHDGHENAMGYVSVKSYNNEKTNPNWFSTLVEFNGMDNGAYPKGSLIQAENQNIYGFTTLGGNNNSGVVFEINSKYNDQFRKLSDFDCLTTGCYPEGNLLESSNGKLYGTTFEGGSTGNGVFFQVDPSTGYLTKKFDFMGINGKNPHNSNLLLLNKYAEITELEVNRSESLFSTLNLYPNPATEHLLIDPGEIISRVSISLYDLQGREVFSSDYHHQQVIMLNTIPYQPGIYFLKIDTGIISHTRKIIIQ